MHMQSIVQVDIVYGSIIVLQLLKAGKLLQDYSIFVAIYSHHAASDRNMTLIQLDHTFTDCIQWAMRIIIKLNLVAYLSTCCTEDSQETNDRR